MKTVIAIALAALAALPAAALAAKPPHPTNGNGNATTTTTTTSTPAASETAPNGILYVLRGTLSHYTAAQGATNGSITIAVSGGNHKKLFAGQTLTFATTAATKVILHAHKSFADNDRGIVKLRANAGASSTELQAQTAVQVIDQGSHK